MIDTDDIDQILADPNATTDGLRSIIAELLPYFIRYRRIIRADSAREKKINDATRKTATKFRQRWTIAEDEKVLLSSLTDKELAVSIGRSLKAVEKRRWKLRKPE